MPDISMCEGKDCPKKEKCYRFRAIPSEFQYWILPDKIHNCEYFWPIKKGMSLKERNIKFKG